MARVAKLSGALTVAAALAASGCATKKVAPPPEDLRAKLDVLGLVVPSQRSVNEPNEPVKGTGSALAMGAGQGAAGTFVGTAGGFCQTGDPFACAVGIVVGAVLAPVGAVVGAGVGASKSHSAEEVEAAQRTLVAIVRESRPNRDLGTRFTETAATEDGTAIVPLHCRSAIHDCAPVEGKRPRYGVHLVYSRFVLTTLGRIDPDMRVEATVEATIFELAGGKAVYDRSWGYRSKARAYFELAADGGAGFRAMIAASHEAVARAIARDLFETRTPAPIGPASTGTVWTISGPLTGTTGAVQEGKPEDGAEAGQPSDKAPPKKEPDEDDDSSEGSDAVTPR